MKNVFQGWQKRGSRSIERPLLALVMVFCLIITVPFLSNAAERLDIEKACSLSVRAANADKLPESLAEVGVVIDLYKVADVVPTDDMEAYFFTLCQPYTQLELKNNMSAEQWRAVSQDAAEIALDAGTVGEKGLVVKDAVIGTRIGNLGAGLYLMVARGRDLESYVYTDANGNIVTKAYSDGYTYTFLPDLVALPGMVPDVDNMENAGEWLYDSEVVLKTDWEKNEQYGSIQIVKTLNGFNAGNGPATFVFQVEAVLDGKSVYSNVVTLVFSKAGEKKLLVEKIPIGATVTVNEVYSGASYSLVTDKTKTVTISTEQDIPAVSFTNKRNDRPNSGHSITNHFRHGEDGWKLEKLYDKTRG